MVLVLRLAVVFFSMEYVIILRIYGKAKKNLVNKNFVLVMVLLLLIIFFRYFLDSLFLRKKEKNSSIFYPEGDEVVKASD